MTEQTSLRLPKALDCNQEIALQQAINYYDAVVNMDISRVDNVERNPERTKKILQSYARFIGSQTKIPTIKEDVRTSEADTISDATVSSYIDALKKIFVVEDCPAWNPNLRSKTAIRTSNTRYFTDPSIAAAAMGIGPQDLINDLNTTGLFLKTCACVIYAFMQKSWTEMFTITVTSQAWNVTLLFIYAMVHTG